jgi:hypothetical protein
VKNIGELPSKTFASGAFALLLVSIPACGGDAEPEGQSGQPVIKALHIATIIGTGARATDPIDGDADGKVDPSVPALAALLDTPIDVGVSASGQLFVIDWNGHKIRGLADGRLSFVVGTGIEGDACEAALVDGKCPAAAAQINHPTHFTFDGDGRMVIAAWHNSKIKRLDFGTELVENVCGTGNRKFEGDGGPCRDAAGKDLVTFDLPSSIALDSAQNLFVSDQSNQVVRRLSQDGLIKSVAGHCPGTPGFGCPDGRGYEGDGGPATLARLNNNLGQGADPQGKVAFDRAGNLYIADTGNNVVRKVTPGPDGIIGDGDPTLEVITTVAGTGSAGYSGDNGPATQAELSSPSDVAISEDGALYIADRANDCIRRVDAQGVITTVAGRCGEGGFSGDGGLATNATLRAPYGIALDTRGNLFIADARNNRVRQVVLGE